MSTVSNSKINASLPSETKKLFKIIGGKKISYHFVHPKFGEIDFRSLTPKRAEQLANAGADFIERKPLKADESTSEEA